MRREMGERGGILPCSFKRLLAPFLIDACFNLLLLPREKKEGVSLLWAWVMKQSTGPKKNKGWGGVKKNKGDPTFLARCLGAQVTPPAPRAACEIAISPLHTP